MISVTRTNSTGSVDISQLCATVSWSGDYQSPARELEFGLVSSPTDKTVPTVAVELGNAVTFAEEGEDLFSGWVVNRRKKTSDNTITVRCYDGGMYIKRTKATYQFENTTPEDAAAQIARDYGMELGDIAETGIAFTRNFVAQKLYDIIMTMYTLASETNGKKYYIRFDGLKLCVIEKGRRSTTKIIRAGSNLMDLDTTESIENLVNRVAIYDTDGAVLQTLEDEDSIALYGVFQSMIKTSDTAEQSAQAALEDGEPTQKITVNNLGDTSFTTGEAVVIRELYTGVYGLFWITSDIHTWKRGKYYNKLVVQFKEIMDEKDVGSGD